MTPTPPDVAAIENEQSPTTAATPGGFRVTFARGLIFGGAAVVFGKLAAFVSQYYLGRVFDEATFGLFAMAITAASIGDVFVNGGIRTVVVSRAPEYATLARTAAWVSVGITTLAALLVAASAPLLAYGYYGQPRVLPLLLVLALAIVLSSLGVVQRGKLDSDMRVKANAMIEAAAAGIRHGSLILLAYLGFREFSFVWPVVFVNLFYYACARALVGPLPRSPLRRPLVVELLHQGKWLIVIAIGATVIARGSYFVGGGFAKHDERWVALLGVFFFGYQLCHALFGLFNVSMNGIMQPAFARMRDNAARQAETYFAVLRGTVFLAAPMTVLGALLSPLFIHLLWAGKWDATIPVVQLLALTEAVRQLHFISVALLSARERYRDAAALTMLDGLATVLAAIVGCWLGGLLSLTLAIVVQRAVCSVVEAMYVYRSIGGRPRAILTDALRPLAATSAIGAALYAAVALTVSDPTARHVALAIAGVPFVVAYAIVARAITRPQYDEAMDLSRRALGRRFARGG